MYTNPRMQAVIENWPHGHDRTTCRFTIQAHPKGRGQRGVRSTINPKTGLPSLPKLLTYARAARIVDGEDGRTYILEHHGTHMRVMQSNMNLQAETIWPSDARWEACLALFA